MAKANTMEKVGVWSFYIGLIIAMLSAFWANAWVPAVLLVLGFIVGLLNITDKEIIPFLVACVALIVVGLAVPVMLNWAWLSKILASLVIFVAPAALLGALKAIYAVASNK